MLSMLKRTVAVVAAMALTACSGSGADLTKVSLTDTNGDPAALSDFSGEWAVVNLWASFCKPCVREMPELEKLYQTGVLVVGVNALDRPDLADRLVKETGVTYPVLRDERGDLMAAAGVTALPATFVLGPDGEVRGRKIGETDLAGLLDLLAGAGYPGVGQREP